MLDGALLLAAVVAHCMSKNASIFGESACNKRSGRKAGHVRKLLQVEGQLTQEAPPPLPTRDELTIEVTCRVPQPVQIPAPVHEVNALIRHQREARREKNETAAMV